MHAGLDRHRQRVVAGRPAVAAITPVDRHAVEIDADRLLAADVEGQAFARHAQEAPHASHAGAGGRVPDAHDARQRREHGLRVGLEGRGILGGAAQLEGLQVALDLPDLPRTHAALDVVVAHIRLIEAASDARAQALQRVRDRHRQLEALDVGVVAAKLDVVVGQLAVALDEVTRRELGQRDLHGRPFGRAPRRASAAHQRLGHRPRGSQVEAGVGHQHARDLGRRIPGRGEALEDRRRLRGRAQVQPVQVRQLERRGVVLRVLLEVSLELAGPRPRRVGREGRIRVLALRLAAGIGDGHEQQAREREHGPKDRSQSECA